MGDLRATALDGLPEIAPGTDLAALIAAAAQLDDGDIVAIAHKAVSKAEGRLRVLADIVPGERASALADELGKDARHVQAILDESVEVVRAERGVLITRTRHGFVCANAGIDESNAPAAGILVLLPLDPDASARALRTRLRELSGRTYRRRRHRQLRAGVAGRAARHGGRCRGPASARRLARAPRPARPRAAGDHRARSRTGSRRLRISRARRTPASRS